MVGGGHAGCGYELSGVGLCVMVRAVLALKGMLD